jgi:hypothetical protein
MISATPALRAAWLEIADRLVDVTTEELARSADLDPREPEPRVAARALIGLMEVDFLARNRHIEEGLAGAELGTAVGADVERAARLLDTGLWSFTLLVQGSRTNAQLKEARAAAEDAREQVMAALAQARSAWRDLRGLAGDQVRQQREEVKRAARAQAVNAREEVKRAARAQAGTAREEAKRATAVARGEARRAAPAARAEAHAAAASERREAVFANPGERPGGGTAATSEAGRARQRRAYEEFRETMSARHAAIRARRPGGEGSPTET